jgi:precorrin-3B synthase
VAAVRRLLRRTLGYPPSSSLRPSACPALSRIVAARDGGLCRIKLPGGKLLAPQAFAIADAAELHASGIVEFTNRANMQVRGVKAGCEARLSGQLSAAGLGPRVDATQSIDPIAAERQALIADDARNLLLSPVAGIDAEALHDTAPLAESMLAMLQSEPRLAELSPKFSVLLDGGERLAALDHPHDVWFSAMSPIAVEHPTAEAWFALGLAGQPSADRGDALAAVRAGDIVALMRALLHTFLDLATPEDTRMRHLLRSHDRLAVLDHAAVKAGIDLQRGPAIDAWRRSAADPSRRFGAHAQRQAGRWHIGGQPPLGRIDTATLRGLAQLASAQGDGTLRVTPWQSVLLPNIAEPAVSHVADALRSLGFVLDARDPLARVIACAGSTGCAKAWADTKADALAIARQLPADTHVHLSGCERSCAAAHCAPYTLLAVAPARYDLYRRTQAAEGAPFGEPSGEPLGKRFGERIGLSLTLEEAAQQLRDAAGATDS